MRPPALDILVGASSTEKLFLLSRSFRPIVPTLIQDHSSHDMTENKDNLTPVTDPTLVDEDASGPPISVPEEPVDAGDGGKLKMIVQLVKKCLGVKDIAAMCVFHAHQLAQSWSLTSRHLGACHFLLPC